MSKLVSLSSLNALRGGKPWNPSGPPVCLACKKPAPPTSQGLKAERTLYTTQAIYLHLNVSCVICDGQRFKIPLEPPDEAA